MSDDVSDPQNMVAFAPRLVASNQFNSLYQEGMGLIEDVAEYLDGDGRAASKLLPREASLLYATESMRLTTRLMQLASWLLLQRAVNEGELSAGQAAGEKNAVQFSAEPAKRGGPGWDDLPEAFRQFVDKGDRLFKRVKSIDESANGFGVAARSDDAPDGIAGQLARLKAAFPLQR